MFSIFTSSLFAILLMVLSINLTACSPEEYQLHTQLKRNGVLVGPSHVTLTPGMPSDFLLPLTEADELRYLLVEKPDGSVELQAELVKVTSDNETVNLLPGFVLKPDGETAELSFHLNQDTKLPCYHWSVSVDKVH